MKKNLLSFLALMLTFTANTIFAQDILILRNGDEIKSKVLEVKPDVINYKNWANQDGPLYSKSKSEIFMVKYANGTKEVFNASPGSKSYGMEEAGNYIGTWVKVGRPNCRFVISRQGASFIIKDNCGRAGQAVYKMEDNGNLTGRQGIITISYDKESQKLMYNWPPVTDYYIKDVAQSNNQGNDITKPDNRKAAANSLNKNPNALTSDIRSNFTGYFNSEYPEGAYIVLNNQDVFYPKAAFCKNIYYKSKYLLITSASFGGNSEYGQAELLVKEGKPVALNLKVSSIVRRNNNARYLLSVQIQDSTGKVYYSESFKREDSEGQPYVWVSIAGSACQLLPGVASQVMYLSFCIKDRNAEDRILQGFAEYKLER